MNKKLVTAIVLLLISVILIVLCPSVFLMIIFSILGVILSIISLVLIYLVKKENKNGLVFITNLFGFIVFFFCFFELIGTIMMINPDLNEPICIRDDMVNNCIDKGNGISECKFMEDIDIPCNSDSLENNQFK